MFFRKSRLKKHLQTLRWHLDKINELERARDDYERDRLIDYVLAVNYELTSHAARGIAEVRQAEELARGELNAAEMLDFLSAKLTLPGIRRDQISATAPAEIERMYAEFTASPKGKSPRQRIWEGQ
jgi:hypothetical protein